eukprot:TRINITY_DN6801_c0_g1_i1.p1 TRINITY_DN6801_c0_g1~~TRINITY_DN6801_c0_g1_i1.p1  ORF type:complete len:393 (+),score=79.25 TRINITY_DN6801_c0_g1_i1:322-1500(+)
MIRLGVTNDLPDVLLPYTFKNQVQMLLDEDIRKQDEEYKKRKEQMAYPGMLGKKKNFNAKVRKKEIERKVLTSASIICSTLSSSALIATLMSVDHALVLDTVIVDEAAQAIELSTLIPLKYGCKSFILVGDPCQLPATVKSKKAERYKYEQSLMERLINNNISVSLLDTQYRMHPFISRFPSKHFYNNQLLDGENVLESTYNKIYHQDPCFSPFVFFDVTSVESSGAPSSGHTRSLRNVKEAQFICELLKFFFQHYCKDDPEGIPSIGVMTPYWQQLLELKDQCKHLPQLMAQKITFATIDSFQGNERDLIIISCVRAHAGNSIGFVADVRRMNVALTRARFGVWIVGNIKTLIVNASWKGLICYAEDTQHRISVEMPNQFWEKKKKTNTGE